ncbi:BTB/POZ domain-containing protein 3-like [Haliotis rubra]|uniref:BTB/POZ domain-containing protein 3-like n=1 Tax=Haliotis rubra TaxID=36100 RepID=UPI001EE57573|nr:BTB/POZ domain-containing protein 3-like [Haliotis rubra]
MSTPSPSKSTQASHKTRRRHKSGYVDDWQSGKDFSETNLHMLETESLTDLSFRVGEERETVKAHKYILVSRSCVFNRMLCGPMPEKKEVEIPDIDPAIFRSLIRFLYTNDVTITPDNVIGLLYSSKKYNVRSLEQRCLQFCEMSLTADNACTILQQACLFDEEGLQEKAMDVIKREAKQVLQSESFLELSHECLDRILANDDLKAEEDLIFGAAIQWAEAECKRQERDVTPAEKRTVLGQSLYLVRFPLMSQKLFVEKARGAGVLTDSEKVKILEHFTLTELPVEPFCTKKRNSLKPIRSIERFGSRGRWTGANPVTDAITVSCSKTVKLLTFLLFAPTRSGSGTLSVLISIEDKEQKVILHHCCDREISTGDDQFKVMLPASILLHPDTNYSVSVTIKGPSRYWGIMNGFSEVHDADGDVTWKISHNSNSSFYNSVTEGYISGMHFIVEP